MPRITVNYILLFIALVVLQAVLFNNLVLFHSAVALVFLYLIVEMPMTMSTNLVLTVSFLLGLSVDIFQDTPGLNAMSCTIVGMLRRPIFHLYTPRDEEFTSKRLCINTLGVPCFLKYSLTMVVVYCVCYFSLESLSYFDFQRLIERIVASTIFTFVVVFAIDSLTITRREKRL